jgi:hypothetical protein
MTSMLSPCGFYAMHCEFVGGRGPPDRHPYPKAVALWFYGGIFRATVAKSPVW